MIDIEIEKEKARTYKKYTTYVFVKTTSYHYNGYIIDVTDKEIIFNDDKIPAPFPIPFLDITEPIVPSKREEKKYE